METSGSVSAVQELQGWFDRERDANGLIEIAFCPGSDREIGVEQAAQVAMAMIRHVKG